MFSHGLHERGIQNMRGGCYLLQYSYFHTVNMNVRVFKCVCVNVSNMCQAVRCVTLSHLFVLPAVLLVSRGVHLLCCSSTAFSTVTWETGSLKHGGHSLIMKEYSAYSTVLGLLTPSGLRCSSKAGKHKLFFTKSSSGHTPPKYMKNTNVFFRV